MKRIKKWLLKRFKVKLNFPLERADVKLRLQFWLEIKGDGEPIYLKPDNKSAIHIGGKHVSIRNFTLMPEMSITPDVSFIED